MTLRLDRNRPFGEVLPSGGFYQDGNYFDAHGEFVRSDNPAPEPEPQGSAPPAPTPASTPPSGEPQGSAPAGEGAGEGSIDLAAWAKGEVTLPHYKVVQAMKAAYPDGEFGKSRAAVVDFLVEKGVVADGEAIR